MIIYLKSYLFNFIFKEVFNLIKFYILIFGMKNDEFDLKLHNEQKNKTKSKQFLSKKHFLKNDFDIDEFEDGLNVSIIENIEENLEITKSSKNNYNNISFDEDFSDELDNFSEEESQSNKKKLSIGSQSIQLDFNNINYEKPMKKNYKKKKTKEELDNTPLPIFNCIYCTDAKIVFNHYINNYLSDNYLFLTSIYDMSCLNKLIINQPLIDNGEENEKLLNLIVKNTEYLIKYVPKEFNESYFKSSLFKNLCMKNSLENSKQIKQNIINNITNQRKEIFLKGNNKISNNNNNKYLFNTTSTFVNNLTLGNENIETFSKYYINTNISCNSINFIYLSMNNNECITINNKENNILHIIEENIEKKEENNNCFEDKDELIDIIKFDLKKISKNDIKWDNECYNIWEPEIESDFEEDEQNNFLQIKK